VPTDEPAHGDAVIPGAGDVKAVGSAAEEPIFISFTEFVGPETVVVEDVL
jgi:hypothetical protein